MSVPHVYVHVELSTVFKFGSIVVVHCSLEVVIETQPLVTDTTIPKHVQNIINIPPKSIRILPSFNSNDAAQYDVEESHVANVVRDCGLV